MRLLLTLLALAGLAAPAAASAAELRVPEGKVEHVKVRVTVSGTRSVPSDVVVEHWASRGSSRTQRRDAKTGELELESYSGRRGLRVYDARRNTLLVDPRPTRPIRQALDDEARVVFDQLERGRVTEGPEQTLEDGTVVRVFQGRDTTTFLSKATSWLVRREVTGLDGRFKQVERVLLTEVLPLDARTARKLRPTPRPGARRVKAFAPSAVPAGGEG